MRISAKLIIVALIFAIIILSLIPIYFLNPRTAVLNKSVNTFFENNPTIRWEFRKLLVMFDKPFDIYSTVFLENTIPSYQIEINQNDLSKLNANIPQPVFKSTLGEENKKEVSALFHIDGQIYKAEVRYRGDNYNHWAFKKKSWRIKLLDGSINDVDIFNLIIPEDRMYVQEYFSYRLAQRLRLIVPKHYFAKVRINGGQEQVYLFIQHWSPALIEQNGRSTDGFIVGEGGDHSQLYKSIVSVEPFAAKGKLLDLSLIAALFKLLETENDQEFFEKLPAIIDIDSSLRWIAHSNAMFSKSQKDTHNFVVYINPVNGKIEFIPWNVTMFDGDPEDQVIDSYYNRLVTRILENPEWRLIRDQYILEAIGDNEQLREDLEFIENMKDEVRSAVWADSDKLFLNLEYEIQINKFKKRYKQAHTKLTSEIAN